MREIISAEGSSLSHRAILARALAAPAVVRAQSTTPANPWLSGSARISIGFALMTDRIKIAEVVRSACLEAALEAYEDAGISGLCAEGRWEYAVQAISTLDLEEILRQSNKLSDKFD